MKRKLSFKRGTSLVMSVVLAVGLVGGALPALFSPKEVGAETTVDYKPSILGAKVLPSDATSNSAFMNKYVLTSNASMNVNSLFKLESWKNIDSDIGMSAGNGITRSKLMHDGNDNWYANYKWTFSNSQSVLKELMKDGQIKLTYDGNLTSDHHWNFWNHWKEKWDVARIDISGTGNNRSLITMFSGSYQDEQGQHITSSTNSNNSWADFTGLKFSAGHSGCDCGSSGVSQSVIYLTDTNAPRITSTYIAYDKSGNNQIQAGTGLTAGSKAYVVLKFNENIRFADNKAQSFKLNLSAYNKSNDNLAGNIQADLISLSGNKMVFEFYVPQDFNGGKTDVYINGISNSQDGWISSSKAYTVYYLDESGNPFSTATDAIGNVTSRITDLAGNGINWSRSNKSFGKIYLDNVGPEFVKTEISGNMMGKNTTTKPNEWPADIDRSSVFAGIGDSLTFTAYFSEQLKISSSEISNIKALLNVKDASGNTITLKASKHETASAKSVYGRDAGSYNVSKITFETFTVTEGMVPANIDGLSIQLVGITGMDAIGDMVGNKLASVSSGLSPALQQEFLDVLGPNASTSLMLQDGSNVYVPNSESPTMFTFPIFANDDDSVDGGTGAYASGITGLTGNFSIIMDGESKEFKYYVDTNATGSRYSWRWKTGKTSANIADAEKYELLQFESSSETPAYIHIMLDENVDYNYNIAEGVRFNAKLVVNTVDYAGNGNTTEFSLSHDIDQSAPTAEAADDNIEIDTENYTATLTASFKLKDNYGIKTVKYFWGEENAVTYDIGSDIINEVTCTVTKDFTFTDDESSREGTHTLTVLVEDYNGKLTTWTKEYDYKFTKPVGGYTITQGSVESPLTKAEITIAWAQKTSGSIQPYTMMIIPTEMTENGENVYYAFLQDRIDEDTNIFQWMPKEEGDNYGSYPFNGSWYKLLGNATATGGTFSSYEQIDLDFMYEIYQYVHQYYGVLEVMFVTSEEMNGGYDAGSSSQYEASPHFNNFSYTSALSNISTEVMYLAGSTDYSISFDDIVDSDSNSVASDVMYDMNGKEDIVSPVPTLDGMNVIISIANNKETDEPIYGLNVMDFESSTAKIQYYSGSYWITKGQFSLSKMNEQTITIPYGTTVNTGYYRVVVDIYDIAGNKKTFEGPHYFADVNLVDFSISSYEKVYQYLGSDGTGEKTVNAASKFDIETDGKLTVGLADVHDYWTLTEGEAKHEITFYRERVTAVDKVQQDIEIRVWNKLDENADDNAISISSNDLEYIYYTYTPVRVDEFSAESYGTEGNLLLPLKEGDNIICYEIINTNGIKTSKEILISVYTTYNDFELQIEQTSTEAVITPVVSDSTLMDEPVVKEFWMANDYMSKTEGNIPIYTVIRSNPYEFYMLDKYGNLSYQSCVIEGVDGEGPYYTGFTTGTNYDDIGVNSDGFHFTFYSNDYGGISPEDAYLTFDADYSALLMGLEGEERANNTEQITMKVPVNMEKDGDGYKVWEDYGTSNYGIYRTQVKDVEGPESFGGASFSIEIWGTFKYDDTLENGEWVERSLTFFTYDHNGFRGEDAVRTRQYTNTKPELAIGAPDEEGYLYYSEEKFDKDGNLGIYSFTPLSSINSYGAGTLIWDRMEYYTNAFYTSLPMINMDGIYDISYTDLFGELYTQELPVNLFGSTDIEFKVSDTEYTCKDLIVTAKALCDGDYITSITADIAGETVRGTIDNANTANASIVMTGNGVVTVTTALGKTHTIRVINIDKALEPAEVVFSYGGSSKPEFIEGSADTVSEKITAIVNCGERIEGINGALSYTFEKGSMKGTEYVFEYKDIAGNIGTITAVLPYNIEGEEIIPPDVDIAAPEYTVDFYGMRDDVNTFIGSFDSASMSTGMDIEVLLGEYIAQKYALIFDIEDDSATKLVLKAKDAAAPTAYNAASDTIKGVTVTGSMILVSENAEFDIYIIDEAGNVSSFTGISVNSIDNKAPLVTTDYEIIKDEDGQNVARMYFITEGDEHIISWNSDAYTYIHENEEGKQIVRYYRDFKTNETYTFHYKDIYGNAATAIAEVMGMDVEKPIVNLLSWYGTKYNTDPQSSGLVNKDITAILDISKAVSDVKLYKYDATKADKKGEEITGLESIVVEYTGKNVNITYKENVDYPILVEVIASTNGKTVTKMLSAVTCIDKVMPTVTVTKAELSEDNTKKEFVFTTDEPTVLKENMSEHNGLYNTEHSWITSSSKTEYITFMDEAGNVYKYDVTELVADVDDKLLVLSYSKNADGSGAVDKALELDLSTDDVVYIKANKKAHIDLNDKVTTVEADVWTAFTLSGEFGFYAVKAEDANTGRVIYGNLAVETRDSVAPVITFDTQTVYVMEGCTVDEMNLLINSGVSINDNKDGVITAYEVEGNPTKVENGIYQLTYSTEDEAGNQTKAGRILYIFGATSPFVEINGEIAQPFGTIVTNNKEIELKISNIGLGKAVVKWKAGIKTSGQMKYDSQMTDGNTFTLPASGYYTIYIRTQDRNEYITYIYVED